jgi:Phage integrase, N-terminal SAM-like domain
LDAFAAGWLETIRPTLKPSSWKFYDDNLRLHILPTLGPARLTDIRRRAVLRLIRELRKKDLGTLTIRGVSERCPRA